MMTSFGKAQVRILAKKINWSTFFVLSFHHFFGVCVWFPRMDRYPANCSRMESREFIIENPQLDVGQVDLDIGQAQNLGLSVEKKNSNLRISARETRWEYDGIKVSTLGGVVFTFLKPCKKSHMISYNIDGLYAVYICTACIHMFFPIF